MDNIKDIDSDPEFKENYLKLQIISDRLFVDTSPTILNILRRVCDDFHLPSLSRFFKYLVPPLGAHLSSGDDVSLVILKCFSFLLEKAEIKDLETFLFVYISIVGRLQDNRSPELVRESSEELKLEVLNCISLLFTRSSREVLQKFISRKYYSKLSIIIFLCAQIAKSEKYITLKVKALECLFNVTLVSDELHYHEDFKADLANVLMLIIPGLSACTIDIINSASTQNHKPTVLALRLWSRVASIVLSTKVESPTVFRLENKPELDNMTSKPKPTNPTEFMNSLKKMEVDKKWLNEADSNISGVTKILVTCQNNRHWRVRLELATASYILLSKCGVNIPKSVGYLSEALIYLSQDEDNKVSDYCKKRIAELSNAFDEISERRLADIVEENFFSLLTRFPRIIRGKDITLIEHELTLLCGYLEILSEKHLPAVLRSSQHLDRFLHCLMICTTPNYDHIMLFQEVALRGIPEDSNNIKTEWRCLQYCDTNKTKAILMNLCSYLLKYSDVELLLNRLLDSFNSDFTNRNNILLLLVFLFSSGCAENFQKHSSLLKDIVYTLIDPSLWEMPDDSIPGPVATRDQQRYFIQISLLVDLIGCIAEAAGPVMFLPLLLQCLYPVLESAGHPIAVISYAGQFSLQKLAKLYDEGKVSSLIAKNVDYLAHHLMLKLRQVHRNPRILYILSAIMNHSSSQALPSLHEIINDVLVQSRDMFQGINIRAFLQVFYSYLTCIKKWTVPTNKSAKKGNIANKISLISELLEYKETLRAADLENNDDPPEDWFPNNSEEMERENTFKEKDEEKLPDHIALTRDILLRSLHFLPVNDISRQILVLEIMKEGAEVLSDWESVFLPVVHKIWSPLVERFKTSTDPLLLQRAFSLLMVLAEHSKDFIRARTVKEVLPCLNKVLIDQRENEKKKSPEAYKFTQIYKLQLLLLSGLGRLILDLDAEPFQINPVLEAASHYLSNKQPPELREACVQLLKEVESKYPDLVWLHLLSISPTPLEYKPPIQGLTHYKFETSDFFQGELPSETTELYSNLSESLSRMSL